MSRVESPVPPGRAAVPGGLWLKAAGLVARRIREAAEETADGPRWRRAAVPGGVPEALDPWIYTGEAGIALFLAALERVAGIGEHRELCLRVVASVRGGAARTPEPGIGGLIGLGSLVYALVRIGVFLGEQGLVTAAREASSGITAERIARDRHLDVTLGSAGALLALLALDEVAPGPNAAGATPLDLASACARHLLARRVSVDGGPRAWPAPGRLPASGFAHGAAGICHALLQLFARTGEPELREAAEEGLAFERGLFLPERGNWRDTPDTPGERLMATWCHGAPGIALGRLGSLRASGGAAVREELRTALATTRSIPQTAIDHLCCGNLGRAEILLEASRTLGDPGLAEDAEALALGVLRRFKARGRFGLAQPGQDEGFDPSFFKGAAGIGYVLLRLAEPSALPCLLLLE